MRSEKISHSGWPSQDGARLAAPWPSERRRSLRLPLAPWTLMTIDASLPARFLRGNDAFAAMDPRHPCHRA